MGPMSFGILRCLPGAHRARDDARHSGAPTETTQALIAARPLRKTIGDFLQSVDVQELLLSQRLRDLQAGNTRSEPDSVGESPLVNSGPSFVRPFLVAASPEVPAPDADEQYETYGAF
jgi:hypothetical protein